MRELTFNDIAAVVASPLFPIFVEVVEEYEQSNKKYPPWEKLDDGIQFLAIDGEFDEWLIAYNAKITTGPHGEQEEAIDLINTLAKRILELRRRENNG